MEKRALGREVLRVLSPGRPRSNLVVCLLTVGEDGYPNVCLLSPFQVVAVERDSLLLAVYEESRTLANLKARKSGTLVLFLPPAAYYIKGDMAASTRGKTGRLPGNVVFRMKVARVTRDHYSKAPITSPVKFMEKNVLPEYSLVYEGLLEAAKRHP